MRLRSFAYYSASVSASPVANSPFPVSSTEVLMRKLIVAVALALVSRGLPLEAQQEKDAVLTVVKKVFDGMRTRDTTLMRAQFAPGAHLLGIDAKSGKPELKTMDPGDWIGAVGKGTGPAWDER